MADDTKQGVIGFSLDYTHQKVKTPVHWLYVAIFIGVYYIGYKTDALSETGGLVLSMVSIAANFFSIWLLAGISVRTSREIVLGEAWADNPFAGLRTRPVWQYILTLLLTLALIVLLVAVFAGLALAFGLEMGTDSGVPQLNIIAMAGLGLVLLVWFLAALGMIYPMAAVEGSFSLKHSLHMTRGHRWAIAGHLLMLLVVIIVLAILILILPALVIEVAIGADSPMGRALIEGSIAPATTIVGAALYAHYYRKLKNRSDRNRETID